MNPLVRSRSERSDMMDILVKNVDTLLLRRQKGQLLKLAERRSLTSREREAIEGLVNMLEYILDVADGVDPTTGGVK